MNRLTFVLGYITNGCAIDDKLAKLVCIEPVRLFSARSSNCRDVRIVIVAKEDFHIVYLILVGESSGKGCFLVSIMELYQKFFFRKIQNSQLLEVLQNL